MNTACDREDSRFISVIPTLRLKLPFVKRSYVSSAFVTTASVKPSTKIPFLSCSRITGAFLSALVVPAGASKSATVSL